MKILMIFDSFKGCLSSQEAGEAARRGVLSRFADAEVTVVAAADGGEGMAEAVYASGTGERVEAESTDPLGRPVKARYILDAPANTAYIDLAAASGITLVSDAEKTPMKSSTHGTGRLIADALNRGVNTIYLGLGGSATNDAGFGALQFLGAEFYDENGIITHPVTGADLCSIRNIDISGMRKRLLGTDIRLLCDVDNPFCGARGAVAVYSRQKGADMLERTVLEAGMANVARLMKKLGFTDVFRLSGAGAAGGAAGGFHALAGAELMPGAETLLRLKGVEKMLAVCDLVMTGEGCSDVQTLAGKLPATVLRMAAVYGVPTLLLSGRIKDAEALKNAGFIGEIDINAGKDASLSLRPDVARERLAEAARNLRFFRQ